jgi:aspartate kinase
LRPDLIGTIISNNAATVHQIPVYIVVKDQILLSIRSKDFSFIAESGLSIIFSAIAKIGLRVRLMQNSAISFSLVLDNDSFKIPGLVDELKKNFNVKFNEQVSLVTIRHYTNAVLKEWEDNNTILLEQRSRETVQFVIESK